MAGFPPSFGTGMSPMAGTQPIAPTPTLPGLQPPMGGVPPVGSPIPLSSSNSGIAGYGGSSSGRDKFSKYLQQMNTTAPLALNRGGPVRMRHGGIVEQPQFLPPMDLSRPARPQPKMPPPFGGYGGGGGGIQGALQPLSSYITTQLQQQASQEVGPFIDEVAGNAQETFGLQSGGMTAIAQPAITQMPSLGYGGGLMPFMNKSPALNGPYNPMSRGNEDVLFHQNNTATADGNYAANFNQGGAVPMKRGGTVGSGTQEQLDARRDAQSSFREELEEREAEQNRNDADDRAAAEANQRAALESMFSGQYPSADDIEVSNTAGYDKEPTSYPTANRNSYATPFSLEGGPLFSNTGGLEDPFDRNNRGMTNLGNPASDFLNAESAEGTFEGTRGYGGSEVESVFDDGAKDRMLNVFGNNTVNAGTSGISIPKFSSANFPGDDGYLESSDVGYLGGEASTAGGSDIDPVSSRIELAKRMESLDGLALARSKFGLPPKSGAFGSADEYVNSMKERIDANRPLPDDVLFAAPQEFKNRAFPDFNFDVSDPNTVGNYMNMSSGSSGLTSGLMTGDPFAPTKDSRGYMPYNPKTDDFVRNDTPSTPLPSNDMFNTEDLANQTPTSTGFGFDDDGEGFDSSVMYSDFSEAELEQLSLDGDEGASNALRARNDAANTAAMKDISSKGFRDRPATSMAPPRDDVFSTPSDLGGGPFQEDAGINAMSTMNNRPRDLNRFDFVEEGRDLNRANKPFSSLGGTLGEDMSDNIIDEIPYDASFEREPAVPTFTSASSGGSGLTSEPLGGDPFPPIRDAMGYIPPTPYDASFPREPAARANISIPSDYKTLNEFDLEQLSLDGDEMASSELKNRNEGDNQAALRESSFDMPDAFGPGIGQDDDTDTFDSSVAQVGPEGVAPPIPVLGQDSGMGEAIASGLSSTLERDYDVDEEMRDSATYLGDPVDPMGIGDPIGSFSDFDSEQAGGYEEEALVNDINSEFQGEGGEGGGGLPVFDLEETISNVVTGGFPDENEIENKGIVKLEQLIANAGNGQNGDVTAGTIKAVKEDLNNDLYYNKLDGLSEGNYAFETREELLKRLRAGERNQGWVRDGVSLISKAHPVLALLDKVMIKLTQKDMKEQADLLDGKGLKEGQTATAVRIQKGRHKGKYVGVVIKEGDKIIEYKGHAVMPNQFDNKDPLYDYILGEGFKPGPDDDDSPAPNDPCPAGYVLSGGSCVPIQSVGEDDDTTDDDTSDDDTEDETPTETLDEIIARIRQPSRVPTEPTETFKPITFANQGGAMGVDPLTSGAVTDSLASATQRFLSSLTG